MKVFFACDSEAFEKEIVMKGWRSDVIVEINNKHYSLEIISFERLTGEYLNAKHSGESYIIDSNTLIVDIVSKNEIVKNIVNLGSDYFQDQQPIDLKKQYLYAFQELQNICNWVEVYSDQSQ